MQSMVRLAMGQGPMAVTMLTQALAADPGMLDAWGYLAMALARTGRMKEAEATVAKASKRFPERAEDLRGAFVHHAVDDFGVIHDITVGPQNEQFVALENLPEHVVRAITTAVPPTLALVMKALLPLRIHAPSRGSARV